MTKKTNIPWPRVAEILVTFSRDEPWLRQKLGISPSVLTNWKARGVPSAKAAAIANAFLISTDYLLGLRDIEDNPGASKESGASNVEDAPDIIGSLKKLPVVGKVQAGPDGLLSIDDYPPGEGEGHMLWWSNCPHAYALRIRGESMSPRYRPGEYVGVDPCADVVPSDEVIVMLRSNQRMIKRLLWIRDGQACFESVNQNFQNIIIDMEEIDKLHLVLGNIPKAAFRH